MNVIKIDHETKRIIMDAKFYKNSSDPRNEEYAILQAARQDYPKYKAVRKTIKKSVDKKTYSGLTYSYMEDYILSHESEDTVKEVYDEFNEMILISQCHSKAFRYPKIKKWFLEKYPEIVKFGLPKKPVVVELNSLRA